MFIMGAVIFKEINMTSGIYKIENVKTGFVYVGSSRNIQHRWAAHFCDMRKQRNGNYKMNKDFLVYGEESFSLSIIEIVNDFNKLIEREQFWIDKLNPKYNIKKTATNFKPSTTETVLMAAKARGDALRNRKQSDAERKMRSDVFHKNWENPEWRKSYKEKLKKSPEQLEAMRQRALGKNNGNWGKKRSSEWKEMMHNVSSCVEYTYINPQGREVVFTSLIRYCKENNLNYNSMRALHMGKRKSDYEGWTFKSKKFIGYKKDR